MAAPRAHLALPLQDVPLMVVFLLTPQDVVQRALSSVAHPVLLGEGERQKAAGWSAQMAQRVWQRAPGPCWSAQPVQVQQVSLRAAQEARWVSEPLVLRAALPRQAR